MNIAKSLLLGGLCLFVCSAGAEIIPAKEIVVPAGCSGVSDSEYVVRVAKRENMPNTTAGIVFKPSVKQIAGKVVSFSADMRCTGIASSAAGDHVGGKILISFKCGSGMRFYATPSLTGTADEWKNFSRRLEIPADAADLSVTFGIQQGWGTLEVRNPRMDILSCGLPEDGAKTPIPMELIVLDSGVKRNGDVLSVTVPKRASMPNSTPGGSVALDLTNLRGKNIVVSGEVCYDVNSNVQGSHVGAKVLAAVTGQDNRTGWYSSPSLTGKSAVWQNFSLRLPVKDSTSSIRLVFGIQQAWGKAEFRNLALEAVAE